MWFGCATMRCAVRYWKASAARTGSPARRSEVIEPGKQGLVVSTPDDVDELARAVVTLADPQTRERISLACKPLQSRIAMHRHVDEMLALYHDLGAQTTAV